MKHPDRMLLHSLDAVTPGGLRMPGRIARVILWTAVITSTHVTAFVAGLLIGRA